MKWIAFRVRTKSDAEDIVISSMQDIGLYGAQIEDHVPLTAAEKEQMFVDILPEAGADDGSAVLSFFLEETEDGRVLVNDEPRTPDEVKADILEEMAREPSPLKRQRTWTGSTTGSSTSTSSGSTISWLFPPGRSLRSRTRSPRSYSISIPAQPSAPVCMRPRSSASVRSGST